MCFYFKATNSVNPITLLCAKLCSYSDTNVAMNRRTLFRLLNVSDICHDNIGSLSFLRQRLNASKLSDNCAMFVASVIQELCYVKEGLLSCPLDKQEITEILIELCLK